jgi:hypothetical protein
MRVDEVLISAGIGYDRTHDAGGGGRGRCRARAACLLRGLAA